MKSFHFLTIVATLLLCNSELSGQAILWRKLLDAQSYGESVSMTLEAGNFIIGGSQTKDNIPLIALYGKDGNNFWTRSICKPCKYSGIVFSKELEDGRILFVSNDGNLFITDHSGLAIDTILNLSSNIGLSLYINKVLDFNNELLILGIYNVDAELYGAILSRINTINLKINSKEIWKESGTSFSMAITNDSFLIECVQNSNTFTIRKANRSNQIEWEKNYPLEKFRINDMIVTKDQRILIIGRKYIKETNFLSITGTLLFTLNTQGDSLWQKAYSPIPTYSTGDYFNIFYRIKETREGDFILVGTKGITSLTGSSFLKVSKINAQGDIVWEHIQSIKQGINEGRDFLLDDDQNIIVVGTAGGTDYPEPERAFIMKLSNPVIIPKDTSPAVLLLFPNPCNDNLTIKNKKNEPIEKIELYNIDGKYISEYIVNSSVYNLNTSYMPSGIYLCKLFTLQDQIVRKFCKL